ncbi:hypothetical protein Acr_10g0004310 [Actinidia rufa]|uniref:Uncharacterized protein n=1 Tax=Actinidia rufa TaxID=165716 RepID=A0A7J0F9E3_9ERIC|nr:hypothetical protein Acr_10g0004310 [Actinidia rufa]
MKKSITRIQDLMIRIEQHVRVEEDVVPLAREKVGEKTKKKIGRESKKPKRDENNNNKSRKSEEVNMVFKDPIYKILPQIRDKPFFKWPLKLGGDPTVRDQRKFCSYHKEKGHMTENCQHLKNHMEELEKAEAVAEPVRVINLLHGLAELVAVDPDRYKAKMQKAVHLKEVMHLEPPTKKAKIDSSAEAITFIDDDLVGVQLPHNDALVVTLRIGKCDAKRQLIDYGSSSEVMYYDLFKKPGLTDADLQLSLNPLIGFSSNPIWHFGNMTVPVITGGITIHTEFLVVNVSSPYNAIICWTWLYLMKVIPSTYHQLICFLTPRGVGKDKRKPGGSKTVLPNSMLHKSEGQKGLDDGASRGHTHD